MSGPDLRRRRIHDLYLQELAYFRSAQEEYAQQYPEMSALAVKGADPSVERLLEGAAFLNAAVRARFEDEQVELSQDLLRLLLPQAVRPLPSMVIQRFEGPENETQTRTIPQGAEVSWTPPGAPGIHATCRFRTTAPVTVPPFRLEDVQLLSDRSTLHLRFRLPRSSQASKVDGRSLAQVRLFIDGEHGLANLLVMYLCKRIRSDRGVTLRSADGQTVLPLPEPRMVGFDSTEALLPGWETSLAGYRLLFEYLAYPDRFRFVELAGLEALPQLGAVQEFVVEFPFDQVFPHRLAPMNFRLGCAPSVNLFPLDLEPFMRGPETDEYLVRAAVGHSASSLTVFSVESLVGSARDGEQGSFRQIEYRPLLELSAGGQPLHESSTPWFLERLRLRPRESGSDTWAILSPTEHLRNHTVRGKLIVCNGAATNGIAVGALAEARDKVPQGFRTENLTLPTPYASPAALGRRLSARVVGFVALGRSTLSTREGLARWFDALDLRSLGDASTRKLHQVRWNAIRRVQAQMTDRRVRVTEAPGVPSSGRGWDSELLARGVELRLDVQFGAFGLGEVFVFGAVLEQVLPLQASLGTFTRLVLQDVDTNSVLEWAPRLGHRPLL